MAKQKASREKKGPKKILLRLPALERAEKDVESVMFVDKEDVRLLYRALKAYKPSEDEENLHGVLLEAYEEILVVDLGENRHA
jgi:hypothetical protein